MNGSLSALATINPASKPASNPNPDAELIRLCERHIANRQAYARSNPDLEPEDNPLWLPYCATKDAIDVARPVTLAGLMAKARAAEFEAQYPRGELWEGSAGRWAVDVVKDLLRLAGGSEAGRCCGEVQ